MIPVSLRLYNFTSYGTDVAALDFTRFQTAAISGPNGAGKSSLLDALTWVLWGQSRAGDASDPLVRKGQTHMWVEFAFELDGATYRVKRTRTIKGNRSSTLEFSTGTTNLTEGTIKATQAKIIEVLHLTYEVFINSSYIRQGRVDEFTLKGPGDRKRILTEILGLEHYDRLEEAARNKARDCAATSQALDFAIMEIEADIAAKEERERQVSEAQKVARELSAALSEKQALLTSHQRAWEALSAQAQTLNQTTERVRKTTEEIASLEKQIEQKRTLIGSQQEILAQKERILQDTKELTLLKKRFEQFSSLKTTLIATKDEALVLRSFIQEKEIARARKIAELSSQIATIDTQHTELLTHKQAFESRAERCPTCGTPLQKAKKHVLLSETSRKIAELDALKKKCEQELTSVATYKLKQSVELKAKEKEVAQLEHKLRQAQGLEEAIARLSGVEEKRVALATAQATIKAEERTVGELVKLAALRKQSLAEDEKATVELVSLTEKLTAIGRTVATVEQEVTALREQEQEARRALGAAEQLKQRSVQMEELKQKKLAERSQLHSEKQIYEELATAFGKRGIQAMLIDTAIPEIEAEANALLARLTGGGLQVMLSTQREAKTGGTIETLDIMISDELGQRSYEMFSGGEGFRVNLALRLALSKLLTNRAGAKLQFLIIDEGFGTQDAQGQLRLIEAINAIRQDFAKMVIITHIEELKEMFPTRVEVMKTNGGSNFELIGA